MAREEIYKNEIEIKDFVKLHKYAKVRVNNNYPYTQSEIGMYGHVLKADRDVILDKLFVVVHLDNNTIGMFLPHEIDVFDNKPLPLPG